MSPPSRMIVLSDPLTLVGRELLELLPRYPQLSGEVRCVHTATDDEHQITEIPGQTSLVAPLDDPTQLDGVGAVVLAADADSPRIAHLEAFLSAHEDVVVIDAGRLGRLRDRLAVASTSLPGSLVNRQVRVAHPALVAASTVVSALVELDPI
jgi:hypothetical protein